MFRLETVRIALTAFALHLIDVSQDLEKGVLYKLVGGYTEGCLFFKKFQHYEDNILFYFSTSEDATGTSYGAYHTIYKGNVCIIAPKYDASNNCYCFVFK